MKHRVWVLAMWLLVGVAILWGTDLDNFPLWGPFECFLLGSGLVAWGLQ